MTAASRPPWTSRFGPKQVGVDPDRVAREDRRGEGSVPRGQDRGGVEQVTGLDDRHPGHLVEHCEGSPTGRRTALDRTRSQLAHEPRQVVGGAALVGHEFVLVLVTVDPPVDRPRQRVLVGGPALGHRFRYPQRDPLAEPRQPDALALQVAGPLGGPRQPDGQVVAEAEHRVDRPAADLAKRPTGQVRQLLGEEPAHESGVDRQLVVVHARMRVGGHMGQSTRIRPPTSTRFRHERDVRAGSSRQGHVRPYPQSAQRARTTLGAWDTTGADSVRSVTARPLEELVDISWVPALAPVAPVIAELGDFLRAEVAAGRGYLPSGNNILRAFRQPLDDVRVLIVGQDPYPTPGHPVGLCFSVAPDVRPLPRSLVNIYTELRNDLGEAAPTTGDLTPWTEQGVLLLNRVLTVGPGKPGSHQGKGWETVTAAAIEALVARGGPLVAVLWGRQAQSLAPMLGDVPRVESAHPSPLSAHSGFFGSRPFSRANSLLVAAGGPPVDWRLT